MVGGVPRGRRGASEPPPLGRRPPTDEIDPKVLGPPRRCLRQTRRDVKRLAGMQQRAGSLGNALKRRTGQFDRARKRGETHNPNPAMREKKRERPPNFSLAWASDHRSGPLLRTKLLWISFVTGEMVDGFPIPSPCKRSRSQLYYQMKFQFPL